MLDPALIRPGRFDRIIYVGAPDFEGRIEVLKVGVHPQQPLSPDSSPMTIQAGMLLKPVRDTLCFAPALNGNEATA